MTSETLRHYDRIGLATPSKKDEANGYRYYMPHDIIRLNTIQMLQLMDLSLKEIKVILEYDHLEHVITLLQQAEKKADEKMTKLKNAKKIIKRAREDYEKKVNHVMSYKLTFERTFPKRTLLISDQLSQPSLDNLLGYHDHFYEQLGPHLAKSFVFEDVAGIYTQNNTSHLFAVCNRYEDVKGLKTLPKGVYLCVDCTKDEKEEATAYLLSEVERIYRVKATYYVHMVVVTGILNWSYQIQVCIHQS